jgi:Nucleotidyl transferase AbiEii toxin, Type IV TA system
VSPVTRATAAGRAYLDLRAKARTEGRATEELLVLYALEGFLARLQASGHSDDFVLKGGVLLAAFGTRRATRDVDLAGRQMDNDSQRVLRVIRDIASTDLPRDSDGLVFDANHATAEVIRDDDEYSGVRVSLGVRLATSRMRFHVDVNIGDPIWPAPERVEVPRLLGGDAIELAGYPLQMVYAEKIVTAVQRGVVNTRWRDFGDVWTLSGQHDIPGQLLQDAIAQVAQHRRADVAPLPELLDGYPAIAQAKWAAWRRKQSHTHLPAEFAQVLADFIAFAEPALEGTLAGLTWDPARRSWL